MGKKSHTELMQDAINMGNSAYGFFDHVSAVLEGMEALTQAPELSDRIKLMRLEKAIQAALYLARDGAGLVDSETEALKAEQMGGAA